MRLSAHHVVSRFDQSGSMLVLAPIVSYPLCSIILTALHPLMYTVTTPLPRRRGYSYIPPHVAWVATRSQPPGQASEQLCILLTI